MRLSPHLRSVQALSPAAKAEVSLDQFVNRIEENPVASHGGKKRALTEAEKLLLVQQDELRRLRDAASASTPSRSLTPATPPPQAPAPAPAPTLPSVFPAAPAPAPRPAEAQVPASVSTPEPLEPPSQAAATPSTAAPPQSTQAPAAPAQGGDPLGAVNVIGILAAGVLGGLLYQNKQGAKRTEEQLKSAVVTKQQVLLLSSQPWLPHTLAPLPSPLSRLQRPLSMPRGLAALSASPLHLTSMASSCQGSALPNLMHNSAEHPGSTRCHTSRSTCATRSRAAAVEYTHTPGTRRIRSHRGW